VALPIIYVMQIYSSITKQLTCATDYPDFLAGVNKNNLF